MGGKGIGIAILDTGIYPHVDFDHRIKYFKDYIKKKKYPYDDNGHGTHVAGIAGGSGAASGNKYAAPASECSLFIYKILDATGQGHYAYLCQALQEIIDQKDVLGIKIINISLGALTDAPHETEVLIKYTERAWDKGLVVVVAAGNEGPAKGSVTTPGNSKKVITVGAVDLLSLKKGSSGRGPTRECICKPDILTYGSEIISCGVGPGKYTKKSGTSMATPHVSSVIACLLEKHPHLTNVEVKMLLRDTAIDLGLSRNVQGWGIMNDETLLHYKKL